MTRPRVRFDRHELAGSVGDIGTDLPLLVGMIAAAGLHAPGVFVVFGLMQIATGIVYGLPMPVQPLKGMAALVIAGQIAGGVLFGAGLAIGAVMLVLAATGLLGVLARVIPRCVVRGVQFGLGLSLAAIALLKYVPSQGAAGFAVAAAGFAVMAVLAGNRRVPAGLVLIVIGVAYALVFRVDPTAIAAGAGLDVPRVRAPTPADVWTGFLVLAIPQLPLSLSNSVIATRQTIADLFPDRSVSVRRIGLTYGLVNLIAPWFGGVPVCHGSGGLAGHHAFGGRTGGSVVIYGCLLPGHRPVLRRGIDASAGRVPAAGPRRGAGVRGARPDAVDRRPGARPARADDRPGGRPGRVRAAARVRRRTGGRAGDVLRAEMVESTLARSVSEGSAVPSLTLRANGYRPPG